MSHEASDGASAEIESRLVELRLAAATHYDPTDTLFTGAVEEARRGEYASLYGTSGNFAGSVAINSDRPRLDGHFRRVANNSTYGLLDMIYRYEGQKMAATEFCRHSEASETVVAEVIASGRSFALDGSAEEIATGKPEQAFDRDPQRQLWIPLKDEDGTRLPAYLRITAPRQDARSRRSSYVDQDWLLLPHLAIPDPASPYAGRDAKHAR
jgi:hypothetical protein